MNHRGHLTAGLLTGLGVGAVAMGSGAVNTVAEAAPLTALTAGFAMFPDLDVASVAQRWFARAVVVALLVLMFAGAWRVAAVLGLLALLPMVHHHRGWTHSWLAVPLVPLAVLGLWHGLAGAPWAAGGVDWQLPATRPLDWLADDLPAFLAMACGYGTHLLVDRWGSSRA